MVSVIIPTLNAGDCLDRLLVRLKAQTVPCEIVIIDSSSTDKTVGIAQDHGIEPMMTTASDFNHGGTRNQAARASTGDTLVFFTQDAVPADRYCIERLIKPLEDADIAATYGRQIPREDATPPERFARLFNYPETSQLKGLDSLPELGIKTFFFSNVCSATRRKEFEAVGGFPDDVIMFEDMLFAARLLEEGYKIYYAADAKVVHSHNYGLRRYFRRYADAGATFKRHPWFLRYSKGSSEGFSFIRGEINYLVKIREYRWIPYAILEAMFKYSGYRLGMLFGAVGND
jgi:rhamnosyltransferase